MLEFTNNAATGRKRAPGGAAGMQQCQNHWQAWYILQCAQSRRSGRKEEKLREKSGKLRCQEAENIASKIQQTAQPLRFRARARRRFSMGVWTYEGKPEGDRRTQVIMAPAWMLLIERTTNTDVIMAPAWMLLIERTTNTDVIMAPAWMLLTERPTNTDVIMAPAWMLLIKRTRNMDVIMVPAWVLLIERPTNTDVIMAPAWMLLIERTTNTDFFMPSASASAMRAEGFTPCVVAAAEPSTGPKVLFVPRRPVPKGLGENAFFARLRPVGATNKGAVGTFSSI